MVKVGYIFQILNHGLITANIQARGNLSPYESREIATDVESKLIRCKGC